MTATIAQARDEILGTFQTAWLADSVSQLLPVLYSDVSQEPPDAGAWARVTINHTASRQATLSGETGARRYRRFGFVTVQLFTPTGEGLTLGDELTTIAVRAFEGVTTAPGRVIFRNVRPIEVGQGGSWFQTNVLADFEYDEVR
ncbi:hypothetical protein DRQ50_00095 [bacterium]|nr:MAG: hypothetical protein DRQ50_00095 [bacterium]RKZ70853.1 MAG: hypothetical protein DRQ48_05345 [Gammaproteobacteria bacterium]